MKINELSKFYKNETIESRTKKTNYDFIPAKCNVVELTLEQLAEVLTTTEKEITEMLENGDIEICADGYIIFIL